ncbi:Splicing factor 3A subunit 3 [Thoreauomyces humboldtii]|nr:Splicing factor 3A subunit 3 [Thoreauomyces humboldtii]
MDSILEIQRRTHEEIERVEQAIVDERVTKPKAHKDRLVQDSRVNGLLERIQSRSRSLLDLYWDEDGFRKAEIATITGTSDFGEFYSRLKDIKDYHRKAPNVPVEPMDVEFQHRDLEREETGRSGHLRSPDVILLEKTGKVDRNLLVF